MYKCKLCDKPVKPQQPYCEEHGRVCQTLVEGKSCGEPALSWHPGICQKHDAELSERTENIMKFCWDMIDQQNYGAINEKIKNLDVNQLDSFAVVTWLTSTKWCERYLPAREEFFWRCYNRLVELRGGEIADKLTKNKGIDPDIKGLVQGLEPEQVPPGKMTDTEAAFHLIRGIVGRNGKNGTQQGGEQP